MDYFIEKLLSFLLEKQNHLASHSEIEDFLKIDQTELHNLLLQDDNLFNFELDGHLKVASVSLSTKGISTAQGNIANNKLKNKNDFKNNFTLPLATQLVVNVLVFLTGLALGYFLH